MPPVRYRTLFLCEHELTPARAGIYNNLYLGGASKIAPLQKDRDLSWNFANQIGFGDSAGFVDVIRLYNALHSALRFLSSPTDSLLTTRPRRS